MKTVIWLGSLFLFLSCNQSEKPKPVEEIKIDSKFSRLLSKFKAVSIDTLHVYSSEGYGAYKGVELDSTDAILFPREIREAHFADPPGLFAVYRFSIDSNRLGLIARTPAMYVPSSVKLFFFDKAKDSITSFIELAESWGDAGDWMTKDSWLIRSGNKDLRAFVWVLEGHDNSIEDPQATTTQEWNYYYLLDLSNFRADTMSSDSEELRKRFGHLKKNKSTAD